MGVVKRLDRVAAKFSFVRATLVASNWGIRIAWRLREWARRNSSSEEPSSDPNAGVEVLSGLSLVASYLGYPVRTYPSTVQPPILVRLSLPRSPFCFLQPWP